MYVSRAERAAYLRFVVAARKRRIHRILDIYDVQTNTAPAPAAPTTRQIRIACLFMNKHVVRTPDPLVISSFYECGWKGGAVHAAQLSKVKDLHAILTALGVRDNKHVVAVHLHVAPDGHGFGIMRWK